MPNGIKYKRASRYAYAIGIINATMLSKEIKLGQKILYCEIPIFRECSVLHCLDKKFSSGFYRVHPKLSLQLSGTWSVGHRALGGLPLAGVPPASDNLGCTLFIPCAEYMNDGYTLFAYYIQNYIFRKPIPDYFISRDIPAGNLL